MTRDDFVPSELVVTWSFMLVAAVALYLCQLENSVFVLEQSWLQFVVAMGIATVMA